MVIFYEPKTNVVFTNPDSKKLDILMEPNECETVDIKIVVKNYSKKTYNVKLSAELVYNGGFAPGSATKSGLVDGKTVDHDWSHVVFGASTDYKLAENTYLTPGMYFQKSMDDSVNKNNEFWLKLGLKYLF